MNSVYAYWFELIKNQPVQELTLLTTLFSDKQTNNLVEELNRREPVEKLKGILSRIKSGQLTVETLMAKLPNPAVSKEEIEQRLQKVLEAARFETLGSLGQLLDKVISLKTNIDDPNTETTGNDVSELSKLIDKISKIPKPSPATLRKDKITREKLAYFNRVIRPKQKFTIKFKEIPENRQEFEEKINEIAQIVVKEEKVGEETITTYLGRLENDEFITSFDNQKDFLQFLSERPEEKQKFSENVGKFSPDFGNVRVSRSKKKKRKQMSEEKLQDLVIRGVEFQTAEINSFSGIKNYLQALEKIPYSITPFLPTTLDSGSVGGLSVRQNLPSTFFLTRQSVANLGTRGTRSVVMNPYATVLLQSTYSSSNWFQTFFADVRKSQVIGRNLANLMVLDDIYDTLKLNKESQYGFTKDMFGEINLDDRESGRKKLKEIIFTDKTLKREFDTQSRPITQNAGLYLLTDFTKKEAKDLEKNWNDDLEFDYGELELVYKDFQGVTDEKNSKYVTILVDGRAKNPEEIERIIKRENLKIELTKLRQLAINSSKDEEIGNKFVEYILSLPTEEITQILTTSANNSSSFQDKLNPKNSLIFLSTISDRLVGENKGLVADALEKVTKTETFVEKQEILTELNDKMPSFLQYLKNKVFEAFQSELDDFAKNYIRVSGSSKDKAIRAIEVFKRFNLLKGD